MILRTRCKLPRGCYSWACIIRNETYLDTRTHTKVFCDERVFISAASSLAFFDSALVSSKSCWLPPGVGLDAASANSPSDDLVRVNVLCTWRASDRDSGRSARKSLNDREVLSLRRGDGVRRLESVERRRESGTSRDDRFVGLFVGLE